MIRCDACRDLRVAQSHNKSGGRPFKRRIHHMLTVSRYPHRNAAVAIHNVAGYAVFSVEAHVLRPHGAVRAEAETDNILPAAQFSQLLIVTVYYDRAAVRHELYHLRLGRKNAVEIVQEFKMRMTYLRKHSYSRPCHRRKHAHLAEA